MGILYQAADPIYWVIWLFVLFALMAFNELGRVKLWCGLALFALVPIALTLFVWPETAAPGNEYGTGTWFNWVKTYSALAGCLGFIALRFVKWRGKDGKIHYLYEKRWALCFPPLILAINIAEAVIRDFQVFGFALWEGGVVENLWTISGPWNIMNGIAGILNIIPIVGPWLGGALAALVGVFVSPWIALVALVGTIIIQQVVYTFVSPKIMASSVDIHPALTLIALVAGSAIGGAMSGFTGSLVGMLASIPAVAVMKSVFVYYFEKQTGRQLVAEDGVFFQGTPRSDGSLDPIADATSPHPDASTGFSLPKVGRGKEQRRDGDRQ